VSEDGKALDRETFLAAKKLPIERVELNPELYGEGACVYVRSMTGQARSDYEKRWAKRKASSDPGGFRWDLLRQTMCDENGAAILTEADQAAAMGQDAATIEDIFEAACVMNGLRERDVEDLAGNSEAAP